MICIWNFIRPLVCVCCIIRSQERNRRAQVNDFAVSSIGVPTRKYYIIKKWMQLMFLARAKKLRARFLIDVCYSFEDRKRWTFTTIIIGDGAKKGIANTNRYYIWEYIIIIEYDGALGSFIFIYFILQLFGRRTRHRRIIIYKIDVLKDDNIIIDKTTVDGHYDIPRGGGGGLTRRFDQNFWPARNRCLRTKRTINHPFSDL